MPSVWETTCRGCPDAALTNSCSLVSIRTREKYLPTLRPGESKMLQRSDVSQALRTLLTHDGEPHPARHCTLVELEAYYRQLLAPDDHEDVADHLALCENCSALLLYAVIATDQPDEMILGAGDEAAEIEGAWKRFRASLATGTGSPGDADLEAEIDRCYAEILELTRSAVSNTSEMPSRIDRAFSRLRTLQSREAAGFRQLFESNLRMPPDAGARIISRAEALREKLEDLVASDLTSPRTDTA